MYMRSKKQGAIMISMIVFASVAITVTMGLVNWGSAMLRSIRTVQYREQAFQIAEAGIDYYRWHLAHSPTDYNDGTASAGPYIHPFTDKDGNVIGSFSLTITPPPIGSTLVNIISVGTVSTTPPISRKIKASLAIPSFARFAIVANDNMYFGSGTEVFGPIHSNGGIHFDGVAHNQVTSALSQYNDPDHPSVTVFGVYTTDYPTDPHPPAAVPSRPDVFMAGREFPVPAVDFDGVTLTLSQIKSLAQSGGRYFTASGRQGYHLVLKTNDTFDLYRVTSVRSSPSSNCKNVLSQEGWGTWSIQNEQLIGNYTFPANGLIFLEDHTWVDGTVNGARLTIATGKFPEAEGQYKNIIVNRDLKYTNFDGQDVVGLIAQGNMNVGLYSYDDLRIDAALISQHGRVGRHYYNSYCGSEYKRDSLTLYGMIGTNQRYGFAYTDNTGYNLRTITYDGSLLYNPPPSFPLSSSQYQVLSWQELVN